MKLIIMEWNPTLDGYQKSWLADNESQVTASFDPDSTPGSTIYVISTKNVYVKNTNGRWQKAGTTSEVSA